MAGYEPDSETIAFGHDWWEEPVVPAAAPPRWTILLAFYNEADAIVATLQQLRRQTRPFRLILIDNGSTDCSVALCHGALAGRGIDYVILHQGEIAGQTAAFNAGLARGETEFVATCDADTFYPHGYLAQAERLLDDPGGRTVAASACFVPRDSPGIRTAAMTLHQSLASLLLPRQTHVGAAGHCFSTDALRAAGGYDMLRWPYVLGDHEVMHRVMKLGRQRMAPSHWCSPSERRRVPIRWTLLERLAYHLTPFALKDRYFRWLGRRFARRELFAERMRIRDWQGAR